MQKQDFETYEKCFQDFKILPKFSETHIFLRYHSPLLLNEKVGDACLKI